MNQQMGLKITDWTCDQQYSFRENGIFFLNAEHVSWEEHICYTDEIRM